MAIGVRARIQSAFAETGGNRETGCCNSLIRPELREIPHIAPAWSASASGSWNQPCPISGDLSGIMGVFLSNARGAFETRRREHRQRGPSIPTGVVGWAGETTAFLQSSGLENLRSALAPS